MKDRRTTPSWEVALEAEEAESGKSQTLCGWPGCTRPRAPAPATGRPPEYCEKADDGEHPHDSARAAAARKRAETITFATATPGSHIEAVQRLEDLGGRFIEELQRFEAGSHWAADVDRHARELAVTKAECRRRIAEIEGDLTAAHARLDVSQERAAAADEEIAMLREETTALRGELEGERGALVRLRDEMAEQAEVHAGMEAARDEARVALRQAEADLASASASADALQREVTLVLEARDEARKERDLARRDRDRRERELRALRKEYDRFRSQAGRSGSADPTSGETDAGGEPGSAAA